MYIDGVWGCVQRRGTRFEENNFIGEKKRKKKKTGMRERKEEENEKDERKRKEGAFRKGGEKIK